jgi:hypothetical protein
MLLVTRFPALEEAPDPHPAELARWEDEGGATPPAACACRAREALAVLLPACEEVEQALARWHADEYSLFPDGPLDVLERRLFPALARARAVLAGRV